MSDEQAPVFQQVDEFVQVSEFEYASEAELMREYANYMNDPENLESATNYLYDSILEEMIMGVVFEIHYLNKTRLGEALQGSPEDPEKFAIIDSPDVDVFGSGGSRKTADFLCPNCDRPVASSRFAPHLEKCMGIGRTASRVASRRINAGVNAQSQQRSEERENSQYFSPSVSEDDDDADWATDKKKKKGSASKSNGTKKNGKSSGSNSNGNGSSRSNTD